MTKTTKAALAYKKVYNAQPEIKKRRAENNKARREMLAAGKVHKGDGKDVAHIKALDNGGTTTPGNLVVESAHKNRGWRGGKSGYNV